jgi:hypothetical protein
MEDTMRVGSVVYATAQGLGYLARGFYEAGLVNDVLVIAHGSRPPVPHWYPNSTCLTNLKDKQQVAYAKTWCEQFDLMLFFETPFLWELLPHCKARGVRTVLMPMYECMPRQLPYQPDAFLNPSLLDQAYYPAGHYLPVPVQGVPWRLRTRADVFVHNAGNGGLNGRNGTRELYQALPLLKKPTRLVLRYQERPIEELPTYPTTVKIGQATVQCLPGTIPQEDLYTVGDVFVFPEKFNGLSLPMQEAYASGMMVMGSFRYPMTEWLPIDCLIPVQGVKHQALYPRLNVIGQATIHPSLIAETMDRWNGELIAWHSQSGREYAEKHSWEVYRSRYQAFLESCLSVEHPEHPSPSPI